MGIKDDKLVEIGVVVVVVKMEPVDDHEDHGAEDDPGVHDAVDEVWFARGVSWGRRAISRVVHQQRLSPVCGTTGGFITYYSPPLGWKISTQPCKLQKQKRVKPTEKKKYKGTGNPIQMHTCRCDVQDMATPQAVIIHQTSAASKGLRNEQTG